MNVNFKVYWNNPIEMTAEAGTQQLTFEVPLGAIIPNPSGGGDLTNYYTKVETDTEITNAVSVKADTTYVDTQDSFLQDQIDLKADAMAVSQSLALKADLIGGLIPASQLPSFVDDVLNFPNLVSFPPLGEDGKIYVAEDVNKTYRWGGSSYVEIGGGGVALGETSSTAYRGDRGKIAYDHSLAQGNPHNTTTSEITEGNNKYFTDLRVRNTILSGLVKTDSSNVTNTDTVEIAVGKLAAKSEETTTISWIPASTVGSAATGLDISFFEFAKINDMLFCRGFVKVNSTLTSGIPCFSITNNTYKIIRPLTTTSKTFTVGFSILNGVSTAQGLRFMVTGNSVDETSALTSIQALEPVTSISSNSEYFAVPPNTCLGQLVSP